MRIRRQTECASAVRSGGSKLSRSSKWFSSVNHVSANKSHVRNDSEACREDVGSVADLSDAVGGIFQRCFVAPVLQRGDKVNGEPI